MNDILMKIKRNYFEVCVFLFWYVALFPGLLPFDTAEAIRITQIGQSSNWWTRLYFEILSFTSLGGRSIAITSGLGLLTLFFSLYLFVNSILFLSKIYRKRLFRFLLLNPLIGYSGMTVSHDVTLVSGILIILATELEFRYRSNYQYERSVLARWIMLIFAYILLSTNYIGWIFALLHLALLVKRRFLSKVISLSLIFAFVAIFLNFGLASNLGYKFDGPALPFFADLKCITSYKDAELTSKDKDFLLSLAVVDFWQERVDCSTIDNTIQAANKYRVQVPNLNLNFLRGYFEIATKNPRITWFSHSQKALQALPPPLSTFAWNQNLDLKLRAERDGFFYWEYNAIEVVHLSVDEISVQVKLPEVWQRFQDFVLFGGLMINAGSWFWGWGGLWLLLFFVFGCIKYKFEMGKLALLCAVWLFPLHAFLFLMGPSPVPRYTLITLILGQVFFSMLFISRSLSLSLETNPSTKKCV